jgi:hypothetical protein
LIFARFWLKPGSGTFGFRNRKSPVANHKSAKDNCQNGFNTAPPISEKGAGVLAVAPEEPDKVALDGITHVRENP